MCKMVYHEFTCPECGQVITLPRKSSKKRKRGHIKDLYCPTCKEVRKFVENY